MSNNQLIPSLVWYAELSSATSIAVVVICFIAMTIFIFLVRNFDVLRDNPGTGISSVVKERPMVKVSNPFFLHMDFTTSNLNDGLKGKLSCLCPAQMYLLWGPKLNPLHNLLLKPGLDVQKSLCDKADQNFKELSCLHVDR